MKTKIEETVTYKLCEFDADNGRIPLRPDPDSVIYQTLDMDEICEVILNCVINGTPIESLHVYEEVSFGASKLFIKAEVAQ